MIAANESSVGKAYAFFYCKAPKQEVETELPYIREMVETPSELELSLIEGMDNVTGDKRLTAIALECKQYGLNYVLEATCPYKTHKDTSDEVVSILNQASQSSLYRVDEPFIGKVVYEENCNYVSAMSSGLINRLIR